ncbi:Homeobox domain [Trinorchestia longiramus]|nr:Homeobox domain [Trinorchestia longiramus]
MQNFPVPQLQWVHTQPQTTQPSPPPSPPTSCVSGWPLRTQASRVSSFTIDAILAHQRSPHKTASSVDHHSKIAVQDMRLSSRPSPYPNSVDIGSPTNNGSVTSTGKTNKTKRIRTIFTAEQLERLEAEFARQQYMVGPERVYLAQSLRLSEAQVKVWFQNRRIKWRKQTTEKQQKRFPNAFMDHLDHENSQSPPSSPEQLEVSSTDLSVKNEEASSSLSMEKLPVNAADEQQSLNSGVQQASRSSSPLLSPSGNPSASVSPPSTMTSTDPGYEVLQNMSNSCPNSKYFSKDAVNLSNVFDRNNMSTDSHPKFKHCLSVVGTNHAASHQQSAKEISFQSPLKNSS